MNYLLWQLADSGFPAGGFAHSGGLEASMHHGHVTGGDSLWTFAQQTLIQTGRSALPIAAAVHREAGLMADMDHLSDVFLSNPVANRASVAQGRAFLTSVSRAFPHAPLALVESHVHEQGLAGHLAPVFGAVLRELGVDLQDAQRLYLYLAGRGIGSAAVRLGLIGAYEAQQLQASLAGQIDRVIEQCRDLLPLDIAQTAPLIDLFQATQDRLYSRLFQS